MQETIGHLHVISDETIQDRFTHAELAEHAVAGGADVVQFRDKRRGARELVEIAGVMHEVCARAGVPLIINDRVDVAMAVGADGVHLGQDDLPIAEARRLLGPSSIIGGSASSLAQALQAHRDGADYIGFGHIFATASKNKHFAAHGPEVLREIVQALNIPVIAIGGINPSNLAHVIDTGVHGIAVIGAVCGAAQPELAARWLCEALGACRENVRRRNGADKRWPARDEPGPRRQLRRSKSRGGTS